MAEPHYHTTETGRLVKCYHEVRGLLTDWRFWFGSTMSFPLEHWLWEKVPGFSHITTWMGL